MMTRRANKRFVAVPASSLTMLFAWGVVVATPASAHATGFRLSNFGAGVVGTVCVITGLRHHQCTGRVPDGTSRVYTIHYRNANHFYCSANMDLLGEYHTRRFSRHYIKECAFEASGNHGPGIYGKRPNGHRVWLGRS